MWGNWYPCFELMVISINSRFCQVIKVDSDGLVHGYYIFHYGLQQPMTGHKHNKLKVTSRIYNVTKCSWESGSFEWILTVYLDLYLVFQSQGIPRSKYTLLVILLCVPLLKCTKWCNAVFQCCCRSRSSRKTRSQDLNKSKSLGFPLTIEKEGKWK